MKAAPGAGPSGARSANVCRGWKPNSAAPASAAGASADSGVAPLVWPTSGAAPAATAAAAAISPSGTQMITAREVPGTSPRPSGPSTSTPASESAAASAVPSRPAPMTAMRPALLTPASGS